MLQYGVGTKLRISFSLPTKNFKVGPCTLPVLRVAYLPLQRLAAKVNARERFTPYSQSISCLVLPASIKAKLRLGRGSS